MSPLKCGIFKMLDNIEDYLGVMAHEIPAIQDELKAWQDGLLRDLYFWNFLTKYWDSLSMDGYGNALAE